MSGFGIASEKVPTMKSLGDVNKKNDVTNQAAEEMKAEPEKIDFSNVKIEPLFEEEVDFDTFSKSDFRAVKVKECVAVPKSKKNDVKNQAAEEMKAEPEKIDFSNVKIEPLFEEEVDFDTFSKSDFRAVKVKECVAVPKSKKLLQFTLDDGTGTDRTILSGIHSFYEPEELVGKTLIAITNLPPRAMMGIDSCGMLLSAIHEEEGEEKLHLLMVDDHIPAGAKLY